MTDDNYERKLRNRLIELKQEVQKVEVAIEVHRQMQEENPRIDLAVPDEGKEQFVGMTQQEAVEKLLLGVSSGLHVTKICTSLVKGGYGNGRKTAKQIKGSVNSLLSLGAKEGKFKQVGRGVYTLSENHNGNLQNGETK